MHRRGFTLVELLMVLVIISVAMSMGLGLTSADKRTAEVTAAAHELAATLRSARAMAMQKQAIFAVSFHIQNGKGTTGRQINNWDGEHWYRILGPSIESGRPAPPEPSLLGTTDARSLNVVSIIRAVPRCWVGDHHRLAARKVRFLALTDQDNGHAHTSWDNGNVYGKFPATYPRPWCGWWDAASKRLYPWGGYDPALRDNASPSRANSGFYYQGNDGIVTGSCSPATRTSTLSYADIGSVVNSGATVLLTQNAPRPLVNGNWLDHRVVFRPNGQVVVPDFMEMRRMSRTYNGGGNSAGGNAVPGFGDLGDLYPGWRDLWTPRSEERPATSFQTVSGYWWITIAPDIETDDDAFPTAQAAVRSMQPCFRVGINPIGDVRVVQMRNSLSGTLDASITDWSDKTQTAQNYYGNMLSDVNGKPRGRPVADALVPEMLTRRSWWYQ